MPDRVMMLEGHTSFVRRHRQDAPTLINHAVQIVVHAEHVILRVTDMATHRSVSTVIDTPDDSPLLQLHESLAASCDRPLADKPIRPNWKHRRRIRRAPAPPPEWEWCPSCLGDADAATRCQVCDGERITRIHPAA